MNALPTSQLDPSRTLEPWLLLLCSPNSHVSLKHSQLFAFFYSFVLSCRASEWAGLQLTTWAGGRAALDLP